MTTELEICGYPPPYVVAHDDGCPALTDAAVTLAPVSADDRAPLCTCELVAVTYGART